jgi:hypothetical protein
MKTRTGSDRLKRQTQTVIDLLKGMTRDEYWRTHVNSRADMEAFYRAVHPEYDDNLIESLCQHIQGVIDKFNTKGGVEALEESE